MKKITFIFTAILVLTLASCSDFMDLVPTTEYEEDVVFSDAALTQAYVIDLYNNIRSGAKEHTLDGLTDDAYFTHNYGQKAVNDAAISESGLEWYNNENNHFRWQDRYKGIREANVILANIDKVPAKAGYDLDRMKGQTHYLRAHMYHELLRGYGGVPIVEVPYDKDDMEAFKVPRNTVGECL